MLLCATLLGGSAAASASQDAADLVLRHGTFYPVSRPGAVQGSLAVRGGRIAYLGDDAGVEALIGRRTRVVELGGRTVLPGLIDAHSHLANLGRVLAQVQLFDAASYDEVVARTREAAAKAPPGAWVRGRGWDQNRWPTREMPAEAPLSRAVPDHPVWLERVDGHAVLLNAAALRALGIGDATPDPPGGRILRGPDGHATGILLDNAYDSYQGKLPHPTAAELRESVAKAAQACVALGLTTATDMSTDEGVEADTYEAYRALAREGKLPLRVAVFAHLQPDALRALMAKGPEIDPQARVTIRGVKLYADGALGSRGAALVEPYSDDAPNVGILRLSGDEIVDVCRQAMQHGFQVAVHAIGDRANLVVADAYERCFGGQPHPELRFRIEHAQIIRPQDLARMGRLGIIASMQPTHATSDMSWAPARLGESRLERAYSWRTALRDGVRLALGSDFPVESPNPLLGFYAAITRQDRDGQPAGGWLPDQVLTREEALRGFTLDAAWSLFLDDQVGSLDVGKRADLVVLDRDPMTVEPRQIPSTQVDWTLVDGQVVYHRQGAR